MNPPETELAELRARIERLEREVDFLRGAAAAPHEPPVIGAAPAAKATTAPAAAAGASPAPARARREISSTVWIAAAGAFLFLLGAAYGLAVSIERGWISPPVRVGAGLGLGVAGMFAAARLLGGGRRALGVTLLAVGTGTWTFALYFGAQEAELFSSGLGFAGAALAVLAAGLLAARAGSDGAMAVAVATGLAAPLAFSSGQGTVAALAVYLIALLGAQLAAHYRTQSGAAWRLTRGLALGALWLVVWSGVVAIRRGSPEFALLGLAALAAAALVLAWLPGHEETPWLPAGGSLAALAGAGVAMFIVWRRAQWSDEPFSLVLAGLAAVALGLVYFARQRSGGRDHDRPLLLGALALTLLAVLMALAGKWVGLTWSLIALVVADLARRDRPGVPVDAAVLGSLAVVAAGLAAVHWAAMGFWQDRGEAIFFNPVFGAALFTAIAWTRLIDGTTVQRGFAFAAAQFVLVNAVAWEFSRAVPVLRGEEATLEFGALLATLTYAAVGAGGWLRGVRYEADAERARAWRLAGYGWLVVAAVKLLGFDLENADLAFRAVAALAVGALFIGAAFWADRQKPAE